jgi:hypothetical protein
MRDVRASSRGAGTLETRGRLVFEGAMPAISAAFTLQFRA